MNQHTESTRRVAIDARPYTRSTSGFSIYLDSIVRILLEARYDITLVSDADLSEDHALVKSLPLVVLPRRLSNWIWEQSTLLVHLIRSGYDVFFCGSNYGIPLLYFGRTKLILAILDLIYLRFPRTYLFKTLLGSLNSPFRFFFPQFTSAWKADLIVTISHASQLDLARWFGWKEIRYALIPLPDGLEGQQVKKRQFVYVGGVDARKRIDVALKAFALFRSRSEVDYQFILIGRGYNGYRSLIASLEVVDQVEFRGYVDERTKMHLISESAAMVYLSIYEGYGLAIAEAISCGTLVICGEGGAQKEVGGDAAIYVDPTDPESVASAMLRATQLEATGAFASRLSRQAQILRSSDTRSRILSFFS